jgi:hypothetical protein
MLTATLLGAPTTPGVVVGPLKHASVSFSTSQVSSGIRESPPCSFHHSSPASHDELDVRVHRIYDSQHRVHKFRSGAVASNNCCFLQDIILAEVIYLINVLC